jgi:hypothetical protein
MELEEEEQETDPVADDLFQGNAEQVCFRLSGNSTLAHIKQVALRLNALMSRILQFQSAQKKSCKDLHFRVVKRNQNDISRCKQFEKYSGPDDATVQFLQEHITTWNADPTLFWSGPSSEAGPGFSEPQTELLRRFQLAEHDSL